MPASRAALTVVTALVAVVLTSCSTDGDDDAGPTSGSTAEDGSLTWGDGDYGVVLAHGASFDAASWEEQATEIADLGTTVVALEEVSADTVAAAVDDLEDDGATAVALVGGSAGSDAILDAASADPALGDQLILLSPNGVVDGLGDQPKLFIASEDEPVADVSSELARTAPGDDNQLLLLPGSAHAQNIFDADTGEEALQAILDRIEARV